jgi:hypothetical protein
MRSTIPLVLLAGLAVALSPQAAHAEEAPTLAVSADAAFSYARGAGFPSLGFSAGARIAPSAWWMARGARGSFIPLHQSDSSGNGAFEVRTGPAWERCGLRGCRGVSAELGWQRNHNRGFNDLPFAMPPNWTEWRDVAVIDVRLRASAHLIKGGRLALEVNAGLRVESILRFHTEPDTTFEDAGTHPGFALGLGLIARP